MDWRSSVKFTVVVAVLAFALVGLWGLLPNQDAQAEECYDFVAGIGLVPSPYGKTSAAFGFAAGYRTPDSPLAGFFAAIDRKAGFTMRAISVDDYGGYYCSYNGGPCWDRFFSGNAQVSWPGFSGIRPYMVEVIDFGTSTPPAGDYIHISGGGYVNVGIVNRGNISIFKASTAPGCD